MGDDDSFNKILNKAKKAAKGVGGHVVNVDSTSNEKAIVQSLKEGLANTNSGNKPPATKTNNVKGDIDKRIGGS